MGVGGTSDARYGLSGRLLARAEAKLECQAVRQGWVTPPADQPFATHVPKDVVLECTKERSDVPIAELLCLSIFRGLESTNHRITAAAVRTAIAMEMQNVHAAR